jgi:flagellar hook-basal body complex protein FliE
MNGPEAIAALSGQTAISAAAAPQIAGAPSPAPSESFGNMLSQGLHQIETRLDRANELVRAYAVDDSVPIHEVTIALEEARMAVELGMEVRNRLIEGYREIMNMQL